MAMIEDGIFGGTCINVGCIPTKMFVLPRRPGARGAGRPRPRRRHQLRGRTLARDPRPDLRARRRGLGQRPRVAAEEPHVTLFEGHARFVDAHTLDTGTGETITADQIVVAAGSRPVVPDIEGLADVAVPHQRHGDADRRAARAAADPGGRLRRRRVRPRLRRLRVARHDREPLACTAAVAGRARSRRGSPRSRRTSGTSGWRHEVTKLERYDGGVRAHLSDGGTVEADLVLVAVGRRVELRRPRPRADRGARRRRGRRHRRRPPADERRRHLGARRHREPLAAQARLQPRGQRHPAQPAAPRRPVVVAAGAARRGAERGVLEPSGRERRASTSRTRSRGASTTWSPGRTTATSPTAGRWRTPPASRRCSPTRRTGRSSARTCSARRPPTSCSRSCRRWPSGRPPARSPRTSTGSTRP